MDADFINRQKEMFIQEFTAFGGNFFYIAVAFIFLLEKEYLMFKTLLAGLISVYLIIILIRTFYFKDRPIKIKHWSYLERIDASSFPSMHSARGTFLMAALAGYFNNLAVTLILAALVFLIAYSRICLKKHDKIDVVSGIGLGATVYYILVYAITI